MNHCDKDIYEMEKIAMIMSY